MGKIKTFISEYKEVILTGAIVLGVFVGAKIANNTEFMKGARELMQAGEEGRLETDF